MHTNESVKFSRLQATCELRYFNKYFLSFNVCSYGPFHCFQLPTTHLLTVEYR